MKEAKTRTPRFEQYQPENVKPKNVKPRQTSHNAQWLAHYHSILHATRMHVFFPQQQSLFVSLKHSVALNSEFISREN